MVKYMNNQYVPVDSFLKMSVYNFLWSVIGLILGTIIDNVTIELIKKYKIKNSVLQITIQLILCSVVLSFLHHKYNYFGWSLQNATYGLFFVSFFFGTQFKLFTIITNKYVVAENNE